MEFSAAPSRQPRPLYRWNAEALRRNIRFIAYNTRFLILPGSTFRIWRRTFPAVWQRYCQTVGAGSTGTRFTLRKPSLIPDVFAEAVTGRPTGNCSGSRPGAARTIRPHKPNRPIKEILGLPLTLRFREYLSPLWREDGGSTWTWTNWIKSSIAASAPLSESEGEKLKTALHARAERLLQPVMGASMPLRFVAQNKIAVAHPTLHSGDRCPECHLTREPGDKRTGTFASGIVSLGAWTIALFFTGCKHAGENIAAVMKRRAHELQAPIRMCDALSRNTPKGVETLIANCVAHGRRQMVEVVDHFPEQCR
jgi:hypothetical protein